VSISAAGDVWIVTRVNSQVRVCPVSSRGLLQAALTIFDTLDELSFASQQVRQLFEESSSNISGWAALLVVGIFRRC
jgi:hypothetical protein